MYTQRLALRGRGAALLVCGLIHAACYSISAIVRYSPGIVFVRNNGSIETIRTFISSLSLCKSTRPIMHIHTLNSAGSLRVVFALVTVLLLASCSPSFGPLYQDYAIDVSDALEVQTRLEAALEEAGWVTDEAVTENSILTSERTVNYRLLYKTTAILEIVPIGNEYVRVLIHPYRDHLIGIRSKLPYLPKNVRNRILPSLTDSFADNGLYIPGRKPASDSLAAAAQ